jgi:hypothetical protein
VDEWLISTSHNTLNLTMGGFICGVSRAQHAHGRTTPYLVDVKS